MAEELKYDGFDADYSGYWVRDFINSGVCYLYYVDAENNCTVYNPDTEEWEEIDDSILSEFSWDDDYRQINQDDVETYKNMVKTNIKKLLK